MRNSADPRSPRQPGVPEVGVLLPIHNEADNLATLVPHLVAALTAAGADPVVALVDDGSTDDTPAEIRALLAADNRVIAVRHPVNRGYGAAVRSGIDVLLARGVDWIMLMDADGSMLATDLPSFRDRILAGDHLVIGSRYGRRPATAAEWRPTSRMRTFISWLGSLVARCCFRLPLDDFTLGMRAFQTDLARRWTLTSSSFAVLMEMVAEADRLAARAGNVPIHYVNRVGGESKFRYHPGLVREYLRFSLGYRLRRPRAHVDRSLPPGPSIDAGR